MSTPSFAASAHPRPSRFARILPSAFALAALAACGGGSSSPVASSANTLAGTVAVGAPITNGTLRILDAAGHVVASDIAIDASGHYAPVTLSGPAPWRLEACGYAGPNYLCVYALAGSAGTANLTPLTSAAVLLASGKEPAALMTSDGAGLTGADLAAAQAQLREGLAGVLASAGVASDFDFVSGDLAAGSRSGYDGVLDAVGVAVGDDGGAFVQITPRLGSGNLYLQPGSTSGSVDAGPSTASLELGGLESLFADMSAAMASADACASASTGIKRSLASDAQLSMGGGTAVHGPDGVAQMLCGFFASGDGGDSPMWGSRLLSPTLGKCDLSGAAPVCGVSFVLQGPDGDVRPVGNGMGVAREAGAWKFKGDLLPIEMHASAKAQRTERLDAEAPLQYDRALAFEVAAAPGLGCARIAQRDAAGALVPVAYYKPHPGATGQPRLSLWTADGMSQTPSLDPANGATRSADDTWVPLPQGTSGDAVIRNFYRGGRSVTVSLFADDACSSAFALGGKSEFEIEVQGVPPVWSAMASLPWPEVDAASASGLAALALEAGASGSLHVAWSFARGPLGVDQVTVCGDQAACGDGGSGRLGDKRVAPSAPDATVNLLERGGSPVAADANKLIALYGRNADGVDLQSNYAVCHATPAGQGCH